MNANRRIFYSYWLTVGEGSVSTATELVMVAALVVAGLTGLGVLPALAAHFSFSTFSGSPFNSTSSVFVDLSAVEHFATGTVVLVQKKKLVKKNYFETR